MLNGQLLSQSDLSFLDCLSLQGQGLEKSELEVNMCRELDDPQVNTESRSVRCLLCVK